jgi:diguanylate cyclase (GGDEF)-like protein/PAS domain S-box-containing protein
MGKQRIGWLIAFVAACAVGFTAFRYQQRYSAALATVQKALRVEEAIHETLSLLKDAETGQRGFILTGQHEFLPPYRAAQQALPRQLEQLRALVSADPVQAASARRLAVSARAKMEELAQTIALRQQERSADVLQIVRGGQGRRLMESARAEAGSMRTRQRAEVARWRTAAEHGLNGLLAVLIGSCGLFMVSVAAGLWASAQSAQEARTAAARIKERDRALRAAAENTGDLVRIIGSSAEPVYVSPSCERILGFTAEEMLAMAPRALLHEDDRESTRLLSERVRNHEAQNEPPHIHRLRTRDGSYRWFETTFRLVRDGDTETDHIHLSSRDISERRVAEEALREQTARLRSILASMGDGVVVLDTERRLVVINAAAQEYLQLEEGEVVGKDWAERHALMSDGVTPFPLEQAPLTRALAGEACDDVPMMMRDRKGALTPFSITSRPIFDREQVAGCVAVFRDITERKRHEEELEESEQRLRVLSNASFEGVAITRDREVIDVNETIASWLGRRREELLGADALFFFAAEDRAAVMQLGAQPGTYQARMQRPDGSQRPVEVRGTDSTFRGEAVRISVIHDITDRVEREAALKEHADLLRMLSLRDELTGLYNRRGFQELAEQSLRTLARGNQSGCLFFADLDGLKAINDTLGHEIGDQALVSAAQLLTTVFRESDIIARLGGDEFAVLALQCGLADMPSVHERMERHIAEMNRAHPEYELSISVGTALFEPPAEIDLNALMDRADQAMYQQKRLSRQRRLA